MSRPARGAGPSPARARLTSSALGRIALALLALVTAGCSSQLYRPQLWTLEADSPAAPVPGEGQHVAKDTPTTGDPRLEAAPTVDERIRLQVDGRETRPIELRPIPYYGDIELLAAVRDTELALDHRSDRRIYSLTEPASPWLFPLDCFIEVTLGGFGQLPPKRTSIGPAERESVFTLDDEQLDRLSRRAESARARRSVLEPIEPLIEPAPSPDSDPGR